MANRIIADRQPGDWLIASLVTLAALALYGATMPRVITFEDAGLFDSVCYTGGIAHPPGYPLFTLMCTPLFQLPFEPAIIGNSMSAVFGALACGGIVLLLRLLGCGAIASALGGLLLAMSDSFWSQSIIVEVYSLNALFFVTLLYLAIRFARAPSRPLAFSISLVFSLAMANHWPLTVLAFPGLAVICFSRWDWIRRQIIDIRFWAAILATVLLGLSPYLSLLAKQHPVISYNGPIQGWQALWDYFMRKAYASVDHQGAANITDKVAYVNWIAHQAAREITWLGLPFAAAAWLTGHRRYGWPVQAGLALAALASSVGLAILLGFDYDYLFISVFRPYPLVAWCCLVIWVSVGVDIIVRLAELATGTRVANGVAVILGALLLVPTLLANFPHNNRRDDTLAERYSRVILDVAEPGSAVVAFADSHVLPLAYQHFVKGLRPDVTLYELNNVVYPDKLAGKSNRAHLEALREIAKHRPLYSIGIEPLHHGTNYGIFVRHGDMPNHLDQENPRLVNFRHRLINDWQAGNIVQPFDRNFVRQLLVAYSDQLLEQAGQGTLSAAGARDLAALSHTFEGALVTLYFGLTDPHFQVTGKTLLAIALETEDHLPPDVSNTNKALFHYYFAQLYLQGKHGIAKNRQIARAMLLKSFEELPSAEAPGLCQLLELKPPPGHLAWRFRDHCPNAAKP